MKNRGSIDGVLFAGFLFVTNISLTVVFIAGDAGGQEVGPVKIVKEIRIPPPKKKEDEAPVVNLVGKCPPMEGDYQCPMEPQETVRKAILWPVGGSESVSRVQRGK